MSAQPQKLNPFIAEDAMADRTAQPETLIKAQRRSFVRDRSGIAAVEFGLIAPVLIVMLVGVIEVTRAISIDRRFGQVTAMVADLLAREPVVDADMVEGIYGIVEHVMGVWGTSTLKLHITPVRASSTNANDIYVYAGTANRPSFGSSAVSPKAVCARVTGLTANLLEREGTALIVEGEYGYTPLLGEGILTTQTWKDRSVLAPRTGCTSFESSASLPAGEQPDCVPSVSCE
jgi:Flp pilus assembly protein TadG